MADKLYRCCNTCEHKYSDNYHCIFHHCSKQSVCYNGFSAYSPNAEMQNQEELDYDSYIAEQERIADEVIDGMEQDRDECYMMYSR